MTVLSSEAEWLSVLQDVPRWLPPRWPTIVIAPHPDDETLGAGGLIALQRRRGVPVTIVAVTNGEAAYSDAVRLGEIRRIEQQSALAELGVEASDIFRTDLADGNVTALENELMDFVHPLMRRRTLLVAPWSLESTRSRSVWTGSGTTGKGSRRQPGFLRVLGLAPYSGRVVGGSSASSVGTRRSTSGRSLRLLSPTIARSSNGRQVRPSCPIASLIPPDDLSRHSLFMISDSTSQAFFEELYTTVADPWAFASSAYEQHRYTTILNALGCRHYHRAFEPGCSIGILTEQLGQICAQVEAIDISPTAVSRAQHRSRSLPNVTIKPGALPDQIPDGTFDLIVFSEIGYYFDRPTLVSLARELADRLRRGGTLLAVHWLGKSTDHRLTGDQVHELLGKTRLVPTRSRRYDGFRLDCWSRP